MTHQPLQSGTCGCAQYQEVGKACARHTHLEFISVPHFLAHWWPQLGICWEHRTPCLLLVRVAQYFSVTLLRKIRQNCSNTLCFIFLGQGGKYPQIKKRLVGFFKVIQRFLTRWIIHQESNGKRAEARVVPLPRSLTLRVSSFRATQLIHEIIPLSNSICIWLFHLWNTFPFFLFLLIAFSWRDSSLPSTQLDVPGHAGRQGWLPALGPRQLCLSLFWFSGGVKPSDHNSKSGQP